MTSINKLRARSGGTHLGALVFVETAEAPTFNSTSSFRNINKSYLTRQLYPFGGSYRGSQTTENMFSDLDKALCEMMHNRNCGTVTKYFVKKLIFLCKEALYIMMSGSATHNPMKAIMDSTNVILDIELQRRDNHEQMGLIYYSIIRTLETLQYSHNIISANTSSRGSGFSQEIDDSTEQMKVTLDQFGEFSIVYHRYEPTCFRFKFTNSHQEKFETFLKEFQCIKVNLEKTISASGRNEHYRMATNIATMSRDVEGMFELLSETTAYKMCKDVDNRSPDNNSCLGSINYLGERLKALPLNDLKEYLTNILTGNGDDHDSINAVSKQLNGEIYERIHDEDIRACWKSMQGGSVVESGAFVKGLHEYFLTKFINHEKEINHAHDDIWVLPLLSNMSYQSALRDAIDSHDSGYISVSEVSEFFDRRPTHWSTPQWIGFWAAGWLNNAWLYQEKIGNTIDEIRELAMKAHTMNHMALQDYLQVLDIVGPVITGVSEPFDDEADGIDTLRGLTQEYLVAESREMARQLRNVRYEIDEVSMFNMIVANLSRTAIGSTRMELLVLCLLSELLRYHANVIRRAARADVEPILDNMKDSLLTVLKAFYNRMRDLLKGWHRQRKDPYLQFRGFSYGLYYGLFDHYVNRSFTNAKMMALFREDDPAEYAEDVTDKLIIIEHDRRTELVRRFNELDTRVGRFMSDAMSTLTKLPVTHSDLIAAKLESELTLQEEDNHSACNVGNPDLFAEKNATIIEDVTVDDIEANDSPNAPQFLQDDNARYSAEAADHNVENSSDKLGGLPDTEYEEDDGYATPQDSDDDMVVIVTRALTPECLHRSLNGDRFEEEEDTGSESDSIVLIDPDTDFEMLNAVPVSPRETDHDQPAFEVYEDSEEEGL